MQTTFSSVSQVPVPVVQPSRCRDNCARHHPSLAAITKADAKPAPGAAYAGRAQTATGVFVSPKPAVTGLETDLVSQNASAFAGLKALNCKPVGDSC